MSQNQVDILNRALLREKAARKQAEKILEEKSLELYNANNKLQKLYTEVEAELTRTDSQLQGVFENIVDAYVIMDLQGNILKMNDAALRLLDFEDAKVDYNLMKMVNPEDYIKVAQSFKKLQDKGVLTDFEINIRTFNNQKKIVHINSSIIYDKKIPVAAQGIIRDITELKENEWAKEVINAIAHSILGKLDLYDIAQVINEKIAHYLKTDDCVIYLHHEQEQELEQIAAYGEKINDNNELINKLVLKVGQGVVGSVAKSGKAELIHNTTLDNRYVIDIIERKSEITVPIMIDDKVIGIIDSENERENFYTERNLKVLQDIAEIVALKLKSANELRERRRIEEALYHSEKRLTSLIMNLDSGVLLEDENRKIVLTNNRFCEFFDIPATPEQLIGSDCSNSAEQSKHLFINPEEFVHDINTIVSKREMVLGDEVTMVNGKIYERDYIPIFKNSDYKGHLWSYRDVTLNRKYRKSLEAQKLKYSNIIANMHLGLLEFDKDDNILLANQSFLDMSGYTEEELIGKNARKLFPTEAGIKTLKKEDGNKAKGISSSFELMVKNKKGAIRWWLISGAANYNLNGEIIGGIGIHLDITDLKSLEAQKEILLNQLEKSNDELKEYAHVVSHDLKSPLRNINALISWIKEDNAGKLDKMSLQNFTLIESTLEKMELLISDILNYSTIGAELEEKQEINLNSLIEDLKVTINIPSHISVSVVNTLPVMIGYKTKIYQLFQNLLSNAIKFMDKDKGLIEIDAEDLKTHYKFSIKDNGMGIEEKYHKKIFEIFHSLNKRKDSTGIGLSIVKKIVQIHKGEVWLESIPKEGTTFLFTLKKK